MVTTPEDIPPEPTEAQIIAEKAQALVRNVVAGHPQGAVRRLLLYVIVLVGIGVNVPTLALVALFLLATTDSLA